jgi:acylphosphatase
MEICIRCSVSGIVQGVWYRASTRNKALSLEVTGYARNLPDGQVEVLACGEETAVKALREWLWEGPPGAQVTDVKCEPVSIGKPTGFTTA